jgi:hypothetical protein
MSDGETHETQKTCLYVIPDDVSTIIKCISIVISSY